MERFMKILVESNEMTAPGYPAILFASTENDWVVRASLTDKDIVRLSMGDSAMVFMDAFPRTIFRRGEELAMVADPVTGTYEVEVMVFEELPSSELVLFPGWRFFLPRHIPHWWFPLNP